MKNYKDDLTRADGSVVLNYVLANEREWRYVPPISDRLQAYVNIDEMKANKALLNQKAKDIKLHFMPADVKYLIVENDDDIIPLINHCRNLKIKFPSDTLDKLCSRILTYDQIGFDV